MTVIVNILGTPFDLDSVGPQSAVRPQNESGTVILTAGPGADLFVDPNGGPGASLPDAERFVTAVQGDFTLSAFVSADTAKQFDSGVLLIWVNSTTWAKICVEQDTQGNQRLVSVVTKGTSDDANGPFLPAAQSYLRAMRKGDVFALHASQDGTHWDLLRYFDLGAVSGQEVFVGILAQSPAGPGCTVRFSDIQFSSDVPSEFRSGE